MGEKQDQPFQLSFNASLKVDFQGFGVTSDGGLIVVRELDESEPRAGLQFNFIVRLRVQREDGNEYLFDFDTIVVREDGALDDELASTAASECGKEGPLSAEALYHLRELEQLPVGTACEIARRKLEGQVNLWDWDEDVDLIGVARVVTVRSE